MVDPHRPGLDAIRDATRSVEIAGEHRSTEAEPRVVGERDRAANASSATATARSIPEGSRASNSFLTSPVYGSMVA
jgi:hypothetical protein